MVQTSHDQIKLTILNFDVSNHILPMARSMNDSLKFYVEFDSNKVIRKL